MSETASGEGTRITVDRWRNTYVVAAGHSHRATAIQDVQQRIDRRVAEELPGACGHRLQHYFDRASPEVWRIRELRLNFIVDVSTPAAVDIAQAWSERVASRIADIIARGAESDGVLCFTNRGAYLAQFVLDLAAGHAWSKWYYEEFRGLDMLAAGRAICEALTHEPEQGVRAVLHLAEAGRLDEILIGLTESDAQTLFDRCFGHSDTSYSTSELSQWSGRLLDIWNQEPLRLAGAAPGKFHDALRWIARAALRFPGAAQDPVAYAAVTGLLDLRRVLAEIRSPLVADRLLRDIAQEKISIEDAAAAAWGEGAVFPESGLRFLAGIATGDPDWAVQAAAVLLKDRLPPAHAVLAGESMITLFGGIFLLGPALAKLKVEEIAAATAHNKNKAKKYKKDEEEKREPAEEIARFLRYLTLAKCLGASRVIEAIADPALRLFSGCDRLQLRDGLKACPPLDLTRAQTGFTGTLTEISACEGRCLLAEAILLPSQGSQVVLLRDLASNEWIHAAVLPSDIAGREEVLTAGINLVRELTGNIPDILLHPSLASLAQSQALQCTHRLLLIDEKEVSSQMAEALLHARYISAATPEDKLYRLLAASTQEFAYFSFRGIWPDFDIGLDILGALLARSTLRGFARQLIGFQSSSPEHLCRNFLEGIATVRSQADRIEVDLPRCPLSLVLQLSGLLEQTYTVPWLEGREVCLLPPPA